MKNMLSIIPIIILLIAVVILILNGWFALLLPLLLMHGSIFFMAFILRSSSYTQKLSPRNKAIIIGVSLSLIIKLLSHYLKLS